MDNATKLYLGIQEKALPKLKTCPFCGADGQIGTSSIVAEYNAYCQNDDCEGGVWADFPTFEEAVEAWNTRSEAK